MLSAEGQAEFEERGFTRLEGVFSREAAEAMQARLWETLGQRLGARRDDPSTWTVEHASGLQALKLDPVFEPIGGAALTGALDTLLGAGRWRPPKNWGQFLVSFPLAGAAWTVPHHVWHTDFGFHLPPDRTCGALVLSFLADVPPRGGGTVLLAGSPELVRRHLAGDPLAPRRKMAFVRRALLGSDPWLAALSSPGEDQERIARFMEGDHEVDGIPLRVVELSGRAGDVVLGHPWALHATAPNCGERPRRMRVQRVHVPLARTGPASDA
jgi:hypothetical protein